MYYKYATNDDMQEYRENGTIHKDKLYKINDAAELIWLSRDMVAYHDSKGRLKIVRSGSWKPFVLWQSIIDFITVK